MVGSELSLMAQAVAGPSNIIRVGEVRARESLHHAIREACASAKIEPRQIERACVGVAGAGRAEVASVVRKIISELIAGEIEVVGDMEIALDAAFGSGPGVIVIAGTGSIAYGRNAQGASARAGGWGSAISDEGSAHWIGRSAIAGVMRALDQEKDMQAGTEAVSLFRELKAIWKLRSVDEFVKTANSNPDFAALFPAIVTASEGGDALAQRVLEQASAELSRLAGVVIRRLFTGQDVHSLAVWLSMAGGVFQHSNRVREGFCAEVRKVYPGASLNPRVVEPVAGALRMARQSKTRK